ncbi:hypothetical protein ABENE_10765 [Asticcacaulis benevestitus DSM 16100 = ATCC BAA-896]|uniref:Methyltransferase type 11 domain-containing protein n=2 Tax=Asticcacaulis TaxID=76890 RepID=V4PS60_9CAUL|nr:hypothetical protein ABENE_10765 [Asticcacaulis benevestitus DSM 16100 = ATCC BAA-896]
MLDDASLFDVEPIASPYSFVSETCRLDHFLAPRYRYWSEQLKEAPRLHRKQWEWVYICAALHERGLLTETKRGLGFGVGREPLADLFASLGVSITATDQSASDAEKAGWGETHQHSVALEDLYTKKISHRSTFDKKVKFQVSDMNNISPDLTEFDFCWSACAFEHLGSIEHGLNFITNSLKTLRSGGVSIHTTELNLSSDEKTFEHEHLSLFRKRDFKALAARLRAQGHDVAPLSFYPGSHQLDQYVDLPPFSNDPHLRLELAGYASTSIGIIVTKH